MNRRESLVPCGRTALPLLREVNEKAADQFGRQIGHQQRVGGQVPLRRGIFQEEPTNPMPQRGAVSHDGSPLRTLRSDGWLRQAAPESLSDSAVSRKGPYGRDRSLTWAEDRSGRRRSDTMR